MIHPGQLVTKFHTEYCAPIKIELAVQTIASSVDICGECGFPILANQVTILEITHLKEKLEPSDSRYIEAENAFQARRRTRRLDEVWCVGCSQASYEPQPLPG